MCEAVTVGLIVGGAVFNAYGALKRGQAEAGQLEEQARIDEAAAVDAKIRGGIRAGVERIQTSQTIAEQTLHYAESSIDPTVGTPVQVAGASRAIGELKARDEEAQAAREAWGLEIKAKSARRSARAAREAGFLTALSSIIGGAGAGVNTNYMKQLAAAPPSTGSWRGSPPANWP